MAVTGELNDLSLAELIEFFCNQKKTGRLKVAYPHGDGYFYLQSGSVVHASIGVLDGIEAVFYALTLRNASFTFAPGMDAPQKTIDQPWISVVLEGLRRMDEGLHPEDAFPAKPAAPVEVPKAEVPQPVESKPSTPLPVEIKPPAVQAAQAVPVKPAVSVPPQVETKPAVEAPQKVEEKPVAVTAQPAVIKTPAVEAAAIVPAKPGAVTVTAPVSTRPSAPATQPIQEKPAAPTAPPIQAKPVIHVPPVEPKPSVVAAQRVSKEKGNEAVTIDSKATAKRSPVAVPEDVKPIIETPGFLAEAATASRSYTPWKLSMIFAAVVALVAVVAVPWSLYKRGKEAKSAAEAVPPAVESAVPSSSQTAATNEPVTEQPSDSASPASTSETTDLAKQQREARAREEARRLKAAENAATLSSASPAEANSPRPVANNQAASSTAKKVTVQVTYDENGRVTQASGGDATALRIARQKRFPAGKAGSATITIPIN